MNEILFLNDFFKSERINGSIVITVINDCNKFYGIDATGCKLITSKQGFIRDEPTESVVKDIQEHLNKMDLDIDEKEFWYKIRNRILNCLMAML